MPSSGSKTEKISDNLYLITLTPPISGFNDFIGVWLYTGNPTFIVDVGPSVTSSHLINALNKQLKSKLDFICLTHIHIDHAGGIGEVSDHFPDTPVICHQSGIPHLADPARLWEGTVKTLGDIGRAYGRISPVPEERLLDAEEFRTDEITPVITPGHAPHHVSYNTKDYCFAGETCGVYLLLSSGKEYLRPGTPPKFFPDTAVGSIDKLINLKPSKICFGHFGMKNNAIDMLTMHREQLFLWNRIIKSEMKNYGTDSFYTTCFDRIFAEDPLVAAFSELDNDVQEREKYFIINSIKGFAGYFN